MEPPRETLHGFGPRRLITSLALSIALAVAGLAVIALARGGGELLHTQVRPEPRLVVLAAVLLFLDVLLGGLRLHVLAHRLNPQVTLLDCVRANLANMCMSGLTPSQTGGGAAQLYILQRAGLKLTGAFAVSSLNFLVSTVTLLAVGVGVCVFLPSDLPGWLLHSVWGTLGLFVLFLALVGVLLATGRLTDTGRPPRSAPARFAFLKRPLDSLRSFLAQSLTTARSLLSSHRRAVWILLPATAAIFLNRFALAFTLFRAFQPEGFVAEFVATQAILVLALFFAPTPGASGIAEASSAGFLSLFVAAPAAFGFVVYWRLATVYVPIVFGGLILLRQLGSDARSLDTRSRAELASCSHRIRRSAKG
jgi:uncharacterized protein (TIRG00374 family)